MFLSHLWRRIVVNIVNMFSGTHFWRIKRLLLNSCKGISVGAGSKIVGPIWFGSVSQISIGKNCFINRQFSIEGNGILIMEDNIDIGPNVRFLTGGHIIGKAEHRAGEGISYAIKIQSGVWIGASTTILGNIIVEQGCVIGASTLINKSFPANVLIVGHPGKIKKNLN